MATNNKTIVMEITVKGLGTKRAGLLRDAVLKFLNYWGFVESSIEIQEKTDEQLVKEAE